MKGIILAGGHGNRLKPLTEVTNKHLLPVYNKPMIFYPLNTLIGAGIRDILIVTGSEYAGGFLKLLGSGRDYGCRFTFEVQEEALGIAHALSLAEDFVDKDYMAVMLGDNILEDQVASTMAAFHGGAHIFLKEIQDAQRFGVAEIEDGVVTRILEKPKNPPTNLAVTGLYLYDNEIFDIVRNLTPSARGEFEITDVNNVYIERGRMSYTTLNGAWTDAGTFESLHRANQVARSLVRAGLRTPFEDSIKRRSQRNLKRTPAAGQSLPQRIRS
ncbi:spore coat protein [Candidatus Peregrinibacteria bacterium CG11_big_fil_rev_8_21_14_0_20_46_8]|nr:MAG: spore coat protein [Candidatus Peregrinibacteria bacterium CG11_big_fil_rev_8_21_14_0_20_46_8]